MLACGPTANDDDRDGISNLRDNCPDTPNSSQLDADDDLIGDTCDPDFSSKSEFRICLWGDTQKYVERTENTPYDEETDNWDSEKRRSYESQVEFALEGNCDMVIHLGDMTETASRAYKNQMLGEWRRTSKVLKPIRDAARRSEIIFSPLRGNHDNQTEYGRFLREWKNRGIPFDALTTSGLNHSIVADIGEQKQLIVSVDCGFGDNAFNFLKSQISKYPGMPTIVHSHISILDGRMHFERVNNCDKTGPSSDKIQEYLLSQHQIYLLAGGHYAGSSANLDPDRDENHPSPLLLTWSNFQSWVNGGDGWMMMIDVNTKTGSATVGQYNPKRKIWFVQENGEQAEGTFNLKWGTRGTGFKSGPTGRSFSKQTQIPAGGYYASEQCHSLYFTNDGQSGLNNCNRETDSEIDYLWGDMNSFATGVGDELPVGSAEGSTAFVLLAGYDGGQRHTGPTADWLDFETGFACFWARTDSPVADELQWVENLGADTGIRVAHENGIPVFNFGDTQVTANENDAFQLGEDYQHLCLGWNRNDLLALTDLLITVNGQDACPSSGCPQATGSLASGNPLTVGPDGPGNSYLHELLFVEGVPLTPARAAWIMACGAGDNAESFQRISAYADDDFGEITGPNGETSCSR